MINFYINLIFILPMLWFAYLDFKTSKTDFHKDFKSIIISIGVLGTFTGIVIGLYKFDTYAIKDSIPFLLEGLKTAFITSVVGMFLSILLSARETWSKNDEFSDETEILKSINKKLQELSILKESDKKLMHLQELPLIKNEIKNNKDELLGILQTRLEGIEYSLNKAVETMSKGATQEIIKALQSVIVDFNHNLTEQFGDNFKQLNESVKNMVIWQENYKNSIVQLESLLKMSIDSIDTTDKKIENMTTNYEQINHTHLKLTSIIQTNENQINNLEKHLESLSETGEKAKLMVDSIDEFSQKIKGSLTNQSETLTVLIDDTSKLKQEIQQQLPESLGHLNEALSTLTNNFITDYKSLLDNVKHSLRAVS